MLTPLVPEPEGSALALPAGPLLGGRLVSCLGWRSVLLINLPIIAVAIPAALLLVPESDLTTIARLDLAGAATAAITLAALVYAVINLDQGPSSVQVWLPTAIAVLALAAFLLREHRTRAPMLPLELLRSPGFLGANLIAAAMNLVGIGGVFVATLYLQTVQHRPACAAGAMPLPLFVPLAALAPITGRIMARAGPAAHQSPPDSSWASSAPWPCRARARQQLPAAAARPARARLRDGPAHRRRRRRRRPRRPSRPLRASLDGGAAPASASRKLAALHSFCC